ncbi:MAB_1171c family putative transporter [Streptomyces sp. NPDC051219]|uniref:MAB_1171c family putative transporter n=1 Tax=Streptomyces sp. NPDC051219 TaxID=3155283 RepID=UPI00343E4370
MENAVLILLWLVALWRGPSALRSSKQRTLWAAFAALTLSMTLRRPEVMHAIDSGTGVNNLSTLLKHFLGITAAAAVLEFVYVITRPEGRNGARLRLCAAAATMVALTVLFAFMPRETEAEEFFESSAGSGTATVYLMVWFTYLGTAMASATWLFWGSSRHARAGWLRTGLRLLGTGTAAGVAYSLTRAVYLLLRLADVVDAGSDAGVSTLTDTMKHLAIGLILIGSSVPAMGVAWRTGRHWLYFRRLAPLWTDLTAAVPEVVLGEELRRRELQMRLHRRVVEIRDAILALQPYASAELRDRAEAATKHPAAADACWVEAARRAKVAGHAPLTDVQRRDTAAGDELDLDAEARWLWQIETARRGDVVRQFAVAGPDTSHPSASPRLMSAQDTRGQQIPLQEPSHQETAPQ